MTEHPSFGDWWLTAIFTLVTTLLGLLYWYSIKTYDFWKKKGVPYEPPTPMFGNIKDALLTRRCFCLVHQEIYQRFQGHRFVGIFHARKPELLILDPDLIRHILVKDFNHFHDRDVTTAGSSPLQQNLFSVAGHKWRVLRTKLSPTFTSGRMKNMFSLMEECSENLIKFLQDSADKEEIIEMKDVLAKFATDIIGSCAFGLQMNALNDPNSEFRKMGRKIFENSPWRRLEMILISWSPKLANWIIPQKRRKNISDFFTRIVRETVDYRMKNNLIRNDFLQLLMDLKFKGKLEDDGTIENDKETPKSDKMTKEAEDFELDEDTIAAQAFVFFAAGFETSSTTMSFALHELALHPDVQAALREEVDAALEASGGRFTYEAVMGMKALDKVVAETLRMYAPVQFLRRSVTTDYTVPGTNVHLEKGCSVIIPVYAIHRDPKYYPNPDNFDPERFSEEQKAKRHNYVYLPFGEGPRNCIGMRFGLMQTKLGLATLLSKFEFHVCERTEIPLRLKSDSLVLSSTTGTIVQITNRS